MLPQFCISLQKFAVFLLLALPHITLSLSLIQRRQHYRRPICESSQACSYVVNGIDMTFCDCPGEDKSCPTEPEFSINSKGTVYQFCEPRKIPICDEGQVATSVEDLQTAIHCVCPDNMVHRRRKIPGTRNSEYICEARSCQEPDNTCAVLGDVGVK
ncbi:hypothetical protein WR25_12699 isoform O [Diploscapter pachys]|uniref:Uncharacterized protein n=1 Tax=Diploscapter pachys TaxID=2018661 RepID=A0A2A2LLD2_9BILA|nr:hypothetical protein WR25_12699 isoform E [Diploscapter pachys]PAV87038.1 hypothetical protein WR25_12699 isoform J [Diploscapter pachys]PAV87039.1 hypothetical protein WR25_12699 isoform K [Diploscapter pachys]PAV87043.1 hypothetical protein WR25_12699 isoform O [Diploscapter pachys]